MSQNKTNKKQQVTAFIAKTKEQISKNSGKIKEKFLKVLKDGRYWSFVLFGALIAIVVGVVAMAVTSWSNPYMLAFGMNFFQYANFVTVFLYSYAIASPIQGSLSKFVYYGFLIAGFVSNILVLLEYVFYFLPKLFIADFRCIGLWGGTPVTLVMTTFEFQSDASALCAAGNNIRFLIGNFIAIFLFLANIASLAFAIVLFTLVSLKGKFEGKTAVQLAAANMKVPKGEEDRYYYKFADHLDNIAKMSGLHPTEIFMDEHTFLKSYGYHDEIKEDEVIRQAIEEYPVGEITIENPLTN